MLEYFTMNEMPADKRNLARKRWKILAQVLKGGDCSSISANSASVRRFQTFGLLYTNPIKTNKFGKNWFLYKCCGIPSFSMSIRHLPSAISAETLNGFNNTGNVCVWPSEEVMTYYCMQHHEEFKGQRICELGGGMTCLAGVALAIYSDAAHVELSDGNEDSVHNLEEIIKQNNFEKTAVHCREKLKDKCYQNVMNVKRVLRWGCGYTDESLLGSFDTVICADCLFFDEGRVDLVSLVYSLLKPGGQALMFAPSRNETFQKFAEIATTVFTVHQSDIYDHHVWSLHFKVSDEMRDIYDPSLHYPKMMTLIKPIIESREVTPESR